MALFEMTISECIKVVQNGLTKIAKETVEKAILAMCKKHNITFIGCNQIICDIIVESVDGEYFPVRLDNLVTYELDSEEKIREDYEGIVDFTDDSIKKLLEIYNEYKAIEKIEKDIIDKLNESPFLRFYEFDFIGTVNTMYSEK